ncbi:MAG: 30S ribosomal protein S28e [Candidatus Aenigmatarchaeota archaeon]|nr:30S ribosomal protein S28e [Nanoarchaeota archaeon]
MPIPVEILEITGKLGVKGVSRVRCRIIDGPDKDKVLTRNVVGPVKKGDILILKDTTMDSVSKLQKR